MQTRVLIRSSNSQATKKCPIRSLMKLVNYEYGYSEGTLTIPVSVYVGSDSSGTQAGSTESDSLTEIGCVTGKLL
jgi:hypothetical protein